MSESSGSIKIGDGIINFLNAKIIGQRENFHLEAKKPEKSLKIYELKIGKIGKHLTTDEGKRGIVVKSEDGKQRFRAIKSPEITGEKRDRLNSAIERKYEQATR